MSSDNNTYEKYSKLKISLIYGFSGFMGNIASGVLYPLELIKIRLQGTQII